MTGVLFLLLLIAAVGYVVAYGGWEERSVALALVAAAAVTWANYVFLGRTFRTLQPILVVSEGSVLVLCLVIALRSDRYWPIPVAAAQLATLMSLLAPLFGRNLLSYPLGMMQALWAYLQLAILVMAVVRGRPRTPAVRREGP